MRLAITGASGNVGTALLAHLAATGGYEVVAIARRVPPAVPPYGFASWHAVDVASPDAADILTRVFARTDAVIHLAWGFQPSHDSHLLRRTAVEGTGAVLAAAMAAGVPQMVHMSSAAVYAPGAADRSVDETWPATGLPGSQYSMDKVRAEALVDAAGRRTGAPAFTVVRPGLIGQRAAGAALRRYTLPMWFPPQALRRVPIVPIDPDLAMPAVHAADVAVALERVLHVRVSTVNLAAPDPVRAVDVARSVHGRLVPVPRRVLQSVADVTWDLRMQPVRGSWIDLAYEAPMLDCGTALHELDWRPRWSGPQVWSETVRGMRCMSGGSGPVLGRRRGREQLAVVVAAGTVGRRRLT